MSTPRSVQPCPMSVLSLAVLLTFGMGTALVGTGCSPERSGATEYDGGGGGHPDGGGGPCGPKNPCARGRVCYKGACIPDHGTCCTDDDCEDDTHCSAHKGPDGGTCGLCIEYKPGETDPMCQGEGFSASDFQPPVEHCHWPLAGMVPPAAQVVSTPLVIDLDGDGLPEIVFAPQEGSGPERLVAIHGADCSPLFDVAANLEGFSQIAAADLNGDRKPEIVGILSDAAPGSGHKVAVFNGQTGALLAQSDGDYQLSGVGFDCSGPAIADLDGDGKPEIVAAGMVLHWDGMRLSTLWNKQVPAGTWGTMTLANDMDGDGKLEVISGTRIYDGLTGADKTPSVMNGLSVGGYPAIADFNKDGAPDIVFVQSQNGNQRVMVIDVANNKFLMEPTTVPGGWGGPPTVGDVDGDGIPDFGTAGPRNYFVFSLACLQDPKPARCKGDLPGLLWKSQTKDISSGGTASSVFDFNGDGTAKIVYRDECWLRVYNGLDGKTLFAKPITSGTALEYPVIADVNNDGHADLVVPSDNLQGMGYCNDQSPEHDTGLPHMGTTQGIFVLRDPMNRWMPSRSMWNEHAYHITNINDDGTVPAGETPNWTSYNNYRMNVQGTIGMAIPQGDLTARGTTAVDRGDCVKVEKLYAQMCNRGTAAVAAGVPGTFYKQDPRMGILMPVCTARTSMQLMPGQCEVVSCDWQNPPKSAQDLWFRANDDGTNKSVQPECKHGNDLAFLPGVICGIIPG